MSLIGAGPNDRNHLRTSSIVASAALGAFATRSTASIHRCWLLTHDPTGRSRTMPPSADSSVRRRGVSDTGPVPASSCVRRIGTRVDSWLPVDGPWSARSARTDVKTLSIHRLPLCAMPARSTSAASLRRIVAATPSVHARCTTGTRSRGSTNSVRRMPRWRTTVRDS